VPLPPLPCPGMLIMLFLFQGMSPLEIMPMVISSTVFLRFDPYFPPPPFLSRPRFFEKKFAISVLSCPILQIILALSLFLSSRRASCLLPRKTFSPERSFATPCHRFPRSTPPSAPPFPWSFLAIFFFRKKRQCFGCFDFEPFSFDR